MLVLHLTIRELKLDDLKAGSGFYETLDNLSPSPIPITQQEKDRARQAFEMNSKLGKIVWVAVVEDGSIVGTTSLFTEYKFIRGGGIVGHIEDVVTRDGWEGKQVSSRLMDCAISAAKEAGCYKAILDCSEDNEQFYTRFGFHKHETMMRLDL